MPSTVKQTKVRKYLESLLLPLCQRIVEIECVGNEKEVTLTVRASTKDKHLLIGKDGRTANAVRQLLIVFGKRNHVFINFSVL